MAYPIIQRLSGGIIGLAEKLIREKIDFFPLLFYMDNDEMVNSTIANESEDTDYKSVISDIVKEKHLLDYIYAMNELNKSRFALYVCVEGVLYKPVYIYYRETDTGMEFSKILDE